MLKTRINQYECLLLVNHPLDTDIRLNRQHGSAFAQALFPNGLICSIAIGEYMKSDKDSVEVAIMDKKAKGNPMIIKKLGLNPNDDILPYVGWDELKQLVEWVSKVKRSELALMELKGAPGRFRELREAW